MHRLIALKHGRVQLAEELPVERFDGGAQISFRHHEADVEQRSALRNHAHIDALERVEHAARRSLSATTKLMLSSDPPCEIMRTLMPSSALNTRRADLFPPPRS